MKRIAMLSLVAALAASSGAVAQSGDMKGMELKAMDHGKEAQAPAQKPAVHEATAVVKALDSVKGRVTLAHAPVKSLHWPAMTMGFAVKDKALFKKLVVGKKVNVEFTAQGSDYVVTAVK